MLWEFVVFGSNFWALGHLLSDLSDQRDRVLTNDLSRLTGPKASLDHSNLSSDGRCVQRTDVLPSDSTPGGVLASIPKFQSC